MEDIINELVSCLNLQEDEPVAEPQDADSPQHPSEERKKVTFSQLEEHGMTKTRTIYIYKKEPSVLNSVDSFKPLAGIVVEKLDKTFEFQMVHRKEGKRFGCRPLLFLDERGEEHCGMWCSNVALNQRVEHVYSDFSDVQKKACMAAVAIPLKCVVEENDPRASKYYVLTNWWKERDRNNNYVFPTLDPHLYGGVPSPNDEDLLRMAADCPVGLNQELGPETEELGEI